MTKIVHRGKIFYFKDGHYVLVDKRPQTDIYDFSLYNKFNQFVRKHPFSGIQPTYLRDYAQHIADSFDYSTALAGRGLNLVVSEQGKLFPFHVRNVQKYLQMACEILELKNISTHTMRKFYSTEAYKKSGNDIRLVQLLLNHSSVLVTQRYIGVDDAKIEEAIQSNIHLV